jgi:hypothetical protein
MLVLALAVGASLVGTASPAFASYPTVAWPSGWVNPVQGGGSFMMTTKWGAFSKGCANYDATNDATYYLDSGTSAHTGIDMNRADGQQVVAIADGTVVQNGQPWGAANNNVVVIEHTTSTGEKFLVVYGHLHSDVHGLGAIHGGDVVGRVQLAGTGAHLHLGLRVGAWTGSTPPGASASSVDGGGNCTFNPAGTSDPLAYLGSHSPGTGSPPPSDNDGDGVPDADDRCPTEVGEPTQLGCAPEPSRPVDVNGDGRADLVHRWSQGVNTWLSKGDGTYTIVGQQAQAGYGYTDGVWLGGDVNRDRRSDLVHRWSQGVNTWLSKGDGTYSIVGQQAQAGYGYTNGAWLSSGCCPRTQDGGRPTARMLAPSIGSTRNTYVKVAWTGSDLGLGVRAFQVKIRSKRSSGGTFTAWRVPARWSLTGARSGGSPRLYAGHTYCFAVRSLDWATNWSPWSQPRCIKRV